MKLKFETLYRAGLSVLLATFFWALWANAQQTISTNAPPVVAVKTNALGRALSKLDEYNVTFGLDRVEFLETNTLLGEPLWKYAASLIFIFLAFGVSKFLDFVVNAWLRRWAAKTETKFDDLLLELLHGPVKVVAFVIFLHIGLSVFHWPEAAERFLKNALIIVVACSITYVAVKVVDLLLGLWRERSSSTQDKLFQEHLFPVVRKSLRIAIVIAAILLTAENLGVHVTSLLAGLSIGGLAIGLAAQDTLANLFGAVAIFLDKPFHIGDRIRVDTVDGHVESIGLRSTRVRSLDGHHVMIPNKTMGNAIITNVTRRPNIKTEMSIGLTYDTPVPKLRQAIQLLEDIYRAHPQTEDLVVSFNKFADSSLNVQVIHWWKGTDQKIHFAGMQELNLKIKERFDAEGINFAFPTQTVYLKQDSELRAGH
jgi:MscS family membrane protein